MSWSIFATTVALFVVGVTCLPMEVPATDLTPPKFSDKPSLVRDLLPPENENGPSKTDNGPATDLEDVNEKKHPAMLFVINVIGVKNSTAEDSNDVLHSDVIEEVPSEVAVPLALFLLVVSEEDENHPVSLDDVARDLQKEGFAVEKVVKNGETRLVKVDLDTIETTVRVPEGSDVIKHDTEFQESGKLTSVRRKRHICLHCKLEELKEKIHNKHHGGGYGGGYGGGCGGGCGGGYYPQPVYQPVQIQPVYQQPIYQQHYPPPQQHYPPPQQYYPPQQPCNTCGGGGYGNGGGNAYAQASAQASASSSSGGYGR